MESHAFQLVRKLEKQRGTHVAVELREAVLLGEICVVEAHYLVNVEFAGELASDPSICKVHERDVVLLQMCQHSRIHLLNHSLHLIQYFMNSRLMIGIVVLHIVYEL